MKPRVRRLLLSTLAIGVQGAGCSSGGNRSTLPPLSVVQGRIDSSSFSSSIEGFVATNEDGQSVTAPLENTGAFALSLSSGHQYRLFFQMERGAASVIFPRSNRVDDAFALESDGAVIPLGTIRLLSGDVVALDSSATCPDGLTTNAEPCTVSPNQVSCVGDYASSAATCDDVNVVLTFGSVANAAAAVPAGTLLALPSLEPPCEILGCDLPPPANPPDGTSD